MAKIKRDVQLTNLSRAHERQERQREEGLVSAVVEGEQVRRHAIELAGQEHRRRELKREQQEQMKRELDQLVRHRKERQQE